MFHLLLHIVVDILDDVGESDVHPLLVAALEKGTPLMFVGRTMLVKFAMQQFRDLEATSGWRFVTVSLYNFEGSHPIHRFTEHFCVISVPDRLRGKVPNHVSYSQKTLKCSMPLSLVGWVLRELKIVPCAEDEEMRLLCVTQLPHPPTLLATCLEFDVNVAVALNGRSGLLNEYYLSMSKCMQEFDATYVIEWDGVCKGLLRGEVQMFQTFVVGSGAYDTDNPHDSDDEV